MENYLYSLALAVIFSIGLMAICSKQFADNFGQRIGLVLICFGSAMRLATHLDGHDLMQPRYLLTYGFAVYAASTAYRFWRQK